MLRKRCKITFVVHGSTIYSNEIRLYEEGEYPPLDTNGKYEISRLCHWLKKRSPKNDKVYAAPTMRAVQSAEIIANSFNQEAEVLEYLRTKKEGLWGGYSFDEIEEKFPDQLEEYKKNRAKFRPEGGESFEDYNEDVYKIINKIKEENFGKRIIIVCDAPFVRGVLAKFFAIPVENQNKINMQTGSATQVNFYEGWEFLVYLNYVPV